jgi:hypothetical protein
VGIKRTDQENIYVILCERKKQVEVGRDGMVWLALTLLVEGKAAEGWR